MELHAGILCISSLCFLCHVNSVLSLKLSCLIMRLPFSPDSCFVITLSLCFQAYSMLCLSFDVYYVLLKVIVLACYFPLIFLPLLMEIENQNVKKCFDLFLSYIWSICPSIAFPSGLFIYLYLSLVVSWLGFSFMMSVLIFLSNYFGQETKQKG